ncbi:MAG: formate dehydrogenase accessory sulfurtransferase FdhD [Xanthobacteraceae bacterium]
MMGTPRDLEDFAVGFSIAEGVARGVRDLRAIETTPRDDGIEVAISLNAEALHRFLARRRVRALHGRTSCGICGVEDLDDIAFVPAARARAAPPLDQAALQVALARLRGLQPLGARTHGAHAAAWVALDGELVLIREDVGRHSALDKLVGAALRAELDFGDGFCLITSRCSYEMVQKAAAAGIPALVAISAPTALAIRTAQAAALTLITLDRIGGHLIYTASESEDAVNAKQS